MKFNDFGDRVGDRGAVGAERYVYFIKKGFAERVENDFHIIIWQRR